MTETTASAPASLTGLERELLGCVERLTMASEASAAQFAALERRSTGQISERLNALEDCFSSLLRSQILLTEAFAKLASASSSSASVQLDLSQADEALKAAAAPMNQAPR
jgi:hypothetical protein